LPDSCYCPECGIAVEKRAFIETADARVWIYLTVAFGLVFAVGIGILVVKSQFNMFLTVVPAIVIGVFRIRRLNSTVLVTDEDVRIVRRSCGDVDSVSLKDVTRASFNYVDGGVDLLNSVEQVVWRISRGVFWNHRKTKRVVDEINRRLRARRNSQRVGA